MLFPLSARSAGKWPCWQQRRAHAFYLLAVYMLQTVCMRHSHQCQSPQQGMDCFSTLTCVWHSLGWQGL